MKQNESTQTRLWRWRREAPEAVRSELTNAVVGFYRAIEQPGALNWDFSSTSPNNWHGYAVVEFVNRLGGIERTNLPFRFLVTDGDVYAYLDVIWFRRLESLDFNVEMALKFKEQTSSYDEEQWVYWSNQVAKSKAGLFEWQPGLTRQLGLDR
jgi:hypothetical protein